MDDPPLTSLSEAERDRALERFHILEPFLDGGVSLTRVAADQGVPLRTLQRWVAKYHDSGLVGLSRTPRKDRGVRRMPDELVRVIEGLSLRRPRPSAASVHRRVVEVARGRGWPEPSYGTVYSVLRGLDPALLTLAHEGEKAYREEFDLLYRHEAGLPNQVWQADHTQLDLWVLDERSKPSRPWLTAILDDHSRAIPGYYLSLAAPSSAGTALALHQAIGAKGDPCWPVCGIPDTFYTDNGPDFTSQRLEQVAVDLKIHLVFSEPGQPRGRGKIERFFGTINELFLSALPGYSPLGNRASPPQLTLPQLESRFRSWLVGDYNRRVHGETGQAPLDRWEAGGFLPRLPGSAEQLDLLLLTVAKARRVQRDGIRFEGFRYLDLALADYVGTDVTIRYDPRDLAEIRVYQRDRFVCRAVAQELAGSTIDLKEIVRARNERRRRLRGTLSDRATLVETVLDLQAAPPVPEELEPTPRPDEGKPRLKRYYNE